MSDAPRDAGRWEQERRLEKDIAVALRLRPDPPRVMRLSRKTLIVLATASGLGLGAVLIVALQGRTPGSGPDELYSTDRVQPAEGLSELPRDYGDIPQLGPPLPGELGRAILAAREDGRVATAPAPVPFPAPAADPDEQLRLQEQEAARLSQLFADVSTASSEAAVPYDEEVPPRADPFSSNTTGGGEAMDWTGQQRAFLDRTTDRRAMSVERISAPASPYVLQAGTVIPAALVTGLRSDLPGQVVAQVTAPVYDSPTGRFLLIPQGSRLVGEYDSRVSFGQRRLLLAWTRLILPDGGSIVLEREPGADAAGYAGLEDRVDVHWRRLFLAAGLATMLNIGAEFGTDGDDEIAGPIRDGFQDTIGRAGDEFMRRQLSVPPTLTIRPGFAVLVMVTRDLVLEPYRS